MSELVRVDLGCGRRRRPGFVGVDRIPGPEVDVIADLNKPLPFDDASVDVAHSHSVLEHLHDPIAFLNEVHRILKPSGRFLVYVPHFSNPYQFSDPTHEHTFGLYSFQYVVPGRQQTYRRRVPDHYTERKWRVMEQRLVFVGDTRIGDLIDRAFGKVVNSQHSLQALYERRLSSLVPCYAVTADLAPIKENV